VRWAMGQPDVLVDVTTFLSTPAIAAIVSGVFGMSSAVPPVTIATVSEALARPAVTSVANGVPQPFVGPDPVGGSSLETIARLDGVGLLDRLVDLTPSERTEFVAVYPEVIAELSTSPPAARDVATWWSHTPAVAREQLASDLPGVVGNLEGVPYAQRDLANRTFLAQTEHGIQAQLDAGVGRAMEDELRARLRMLDAVETSLLTGESGERRSLVALDVTAQGRAVIAVGDISTADYVTFFVPGMYVGVAEQLVDWTGNAETSLIEQQEWLERLGAEGEVATVAWIGYHTPTVVNIAGLDLAYQGRDALTGSVQGLDAVRADAASGDEGGPYVSIVAHSYGSTAAMLALQENDITVDALILVGSPGSPATSVDDLKVADGNVWVAAADTDPVPRSGVFGSQPLDDDFGATHFSVRATTDPVTGEKLDDIDGHVYYFWPGTASVRNTALIAIGHGSLATTDTVLAKASAR
jgi:pimeloyl-ACP methyl ester carboxylesterase